MSEDAMEKLTPEQEYQRDYYLERVDERRQYAQDRWKNNRAYREREIQRARDRRALARAGKASDRFRVLVEERRADSTEVGCQLLTNVGDKQEVLVYTSGSLSREVGRSPRAIRMWLADGTLPGATVFISVRMPDTKRNVRRAYFSEQFCKAVYRACEALFYLNGRGEKKILKRLIMKELAEDNITYVPYAYRGDNGVRKAAVAEGE